MSTHTAFSPRPATRPRSPKLSVRSLLKPHLGTLTLGLIAIAGESAANLLQPWPLKIVLDDVLRSKSSHAWTMRIVHRVVGTEPMALLKFACAAVLAIAVLDAICTYGEKYLTTSVSHRSAIIDGASRANGDARRAAVCMLATNEL